MTKSRGFTLIELIMVIVIMGIISAAAAVFIRGPIEGYVAANRRAQLSDSADIAIRRLSRDVRLALPNSVRVGGGSQFLEYIPTTTGSRYRADGGGDILDFTNALDSSFDYLGASIEGATGFLVVFNTGQRSLAGCGTAPGGADAYENCNRRATTGITASTVSFTATANPLPFTSPGHRVHVVPSTGPITFACENVNTSAAGTLRIYTGYQTTNADWGSAAPASAPAGGTVSLLAESVSACSFNYAPINAANGLVTILLTLTRSNETVTLHHQVHVDNAP
jgi:MSHA biogenesis protein MshO